MENAERRKQLEVMLQDDPHDAFLRYALAMELVASGDRHNALEQLQVLLNYTPDYVPAYMQAGKLAVELGQESSARTFFSQGISQAQRQGDAHATEEMQGMLMALE